MANSGEFPISIGLDVSDETFINYWVMDSEATNHMTHSSQKFSTYTPCPSNRKMATTDGLLTTDGYNPSLVLKNVLHVPKLSTSLVSIQKLTQDLCCNVIFHPTYCVPQDQDSGKMIGHAKEQDGLYYLKTPSNPSVNQNKSPLSFFLGTLYPIKKRSHLIIIDLDIHHSGLLKFYFLLYVRG